jgi:hypothetical protein
MNLSLAKQIKVSNSHINDFINYLKVASFKYDSEDLRALGIANPDEVENAVNRAKSTCSSAGLDLSWHFYDYYISRQGQLEHVWKLSKTAFALTFIKAETASEGQAILQTKMAEDLSNYFIKIVKINPDASRANTITNEAFLYAK